MTNIVVKLTRTFTSQAELDHFNSLWKNQVVAWEQSWSRLEDEVEADVAAKASILTKLETKAREYAEDAGHEIKSIWEYVESHLDGKHDGDEKAADPAKASSAGTADTSGATTKTATAS